ncbi:MAG: hypothetical protein O2854_03820 [Chloroflexi bacterium]|nr:hypothetical protein [Chloroflexota bacterium]
MKAWVLLATLVTILALACTPSDPATTATGLLHGQVTIGPLVPVLREGEPTPTPNPAVYAARKILVSNEKGDTVLHEVSLNPDGTYQVELPAGSYRVDINRIGIDSSSQVPVVIRIDEGATTTLDIDIDTGIR